MPSGHGVQTGSKYQIQDARLAAAVKFLFRTSKRVVTEVIIMVAGQDGAFVGGVKVVRSQVADFIDV